jgi:DNA-binding NarL/FixJ family response regulator
MTRVLIVDDYAPFRARARALLEAEGFRVVGEASTAGEALAAAEKERPDLVLLDVHLPDSDGFDAAERLTSAARGVNVVLVCSVITRISLRSWSEAAPAASCRRQSSPALVSRNCSVRDGIRRGVAGRDGGAARSASARA